MVTSFFFSLLLASSAAAHGFVSQVSIAGKDFEGNTPNGETNPSIIRQISDISPVKGADNPDLFCGLNAQVASDVAEANPGDTVGVKWVGGGGENWPHNTGPMLTYLASCGDTPCNEFDKTDAKWFKIQQVGRVQKGGDWAQAALMDPSTNVAEVQLPSNLAPGNYLLRHEIIALHLATSVGGAEFYPSCSQIQVGGSGTGTPEDDELVTFPGAYSDNDPGIFDPDVFDTDAPYDFPGPSIAKFVTDGSSSGSSSSSGTADSNSATSTSDSRPTATSGTSGSGSSNSTGTATSTSRGSATPTAATSVVSGQTCKLRKRDGSITNMFSRRTTLTHQNIVQIHRPKHLSRVMRDLLPNGWSR